MYTKILSQNLDKISKQRDLFLSMSLLTLAINVCLVGKLIISDEKLIMVPGIKSDMWISNNAISHSYLEEMSMLFLSNLLDINIENIAHKKSLILKYSTASGIKKLQEYFAEAEEKYKKFDLTTYFTVKNIEIEMDSLKVIAHGILTSSYGKRGSEIKEESYILQFEYKAGNLRLKSFSRVIEGELDEQKAS